MDSGFISPMLAKPIPDGFELESGNWAVEEKFDGHRIIVMVDDRPSSLFGGRTVRAWSRNGLDRVLPPHLHTELMELPSGVYDGELLVPGERSFGTVVIENADRLVYQVFDVLHLLGKDLTSLGLGASFDERRAMLEELVSPKNQSVRLSELCRVDGLASALRMAQDVWDRDGEGIIIKRRDSVYTPGERPKKTWLKIKQLKSAVLTVVAFKEGRMGPNSIALLRDDAGCETTVKWKTLEEMARIDADPTKFVGKKLRIEFQERTPDGGYRHPRWDRWEDE